MKPEIVNESLSESKAEADALPAIDGAQAIASARKQPAGAKAVNWYQFGNGTTIVLDDSGNEAEWD